MGRNPVDSVLAEIKRIDVETFSRINALKPDIDFSEAWQIQKMLSEPKKGKIKKLRNLDSQTHDYSISNLMKAVYATQEIVHDENPTGILFGDDLETGRYIETDEETVKLLRTLIRLTVSKNQEIYTAFTDAVAKVFSLGIRSGEPVKITSDRILEHFQQPLERNYLQAEIADTIISLLEE